MRRVSSLIPHPLSLALCIALLAPGTAPAQITTDPTRPAIGVAVEAQEGAVTSQLQTVVIAPGRNAAIINGVMVKIGEKYGDAVLERVTEDRVVLRSGAARQELRLHPGVEKVSLARAEPVAPPAAKSAPPSAKAKTTAKAKAKSKAQPKAQAKPKAAAQQGAQPASDSSAGTR